MVGISLSGSLYISKLQTVHALMMAAHDSLTDIFSVCKICRITSQDNLAQLPFRYFESAISLHYKRKLSLWIVCNQGNQYVVRTTNLSSHTVRAQKLAYIDLIIVKNGVLVGHIKFNTLSV